MEDDPPPPVFKAGFNLLLTRYALERMLYRLSISTQRDQFLLKGALLFDLWLDVPHRPPPPGARQRQALSR